MRHGFRVTCVTYSCDDVRGIESNVLHSSRSIVVHILLKIDKNHLFNFIVRRQRGRVVRGSDLESRSPGFKSRSDRLLELFLGSLEFNSSASFVNSELTQQDG